MIVNAKEKEEAERLDTTTTECKMGVWFRQDESEDRHPRLLQKRERDKIVRGQ